MINKVILVGNLGKDPQINQFDDGNKVANFTVATSESYKDKNGEWQSNTEWHNVSAWRFNAIKAEEQLKKGSKVYIEGKIQSRKYQDKEGNDRYITEIQAYVLKSLDKKDEINPMPVQEQPKQEPESNYTNTQDDSSPDGLPF